MQAEVTTNLPTIPSRIVQRLVDSGSNGKVRPLLGSESNGVNPGVRLHGTPGGETPGVSLGPWVVGQRLTSPCSRLTDDRGGDNSLCLDCDYHEPNNDKRAQMQEVAQTMRHAAPFPSSTTTQ